MKFNVTEFFSGRKAAKDKQENLFVICGPCVIESEKTAISHARALKKICQKLKVLFIFKASFDKANRTSGNSFRGPGIKKGLKILGKIKKDLNIPVTSDIHQIEEISLAADVLDLIQIPALLSRQTDLIQAAAKTKKPINVKKGQFMAPEDVKGVVEKIEAVGNKKIIITERGTTFGYHNLVSDMRAIPIMKRFGYPVVFDATHSVQLPSAAGGKSGGEREFAGTLALSAVAAGVDGLFLEVHQNPDKALCDGPNMITPKELHSLLAKAKKIGEIVSGR